MNRTSWRERGTCARPPYGPERTDVWFPHQTDREGRKAAVELCNRCPVQPQCLADAMAREHGSGLTSRFGIYGGLTERQRYTLYRRRVAA